MIAKILVPLLLVAGTSAAQAQAFRGNDTGGIISWSPETQRYARAIAQDHCALYGKEARITSVTRGYGNYIGFLCAFPRVHVRRYAVSVKG